MRRLLLALAIHFLVIASTHVVTASVASCASGSQLLQVKQTGRGHQRALLETTTREASGNETNATSSAEEETIAINETSAATTAAPVNATEAATTPISSINTTVEQETITINETSVATTAAPVNTTEAATTPISSVNTTAEQAIAVNRTLVLTTTGFPVVQVVPALAVGPPVPAVVEWQPSPLWASAPAPMIPVVPGQVIPPAGEPEETQPAVQMVPVIPVPRTQVIPTIVVPNVDCNGPESQTFNNVTVNIAGDQIIYDGSVKEQPSSPSTPLPATVNKTKAPPLPVTAAPVTVAVTTAAPVPKYVTVEFQPGHLGIEADWASGNVTGIDEDSQASDLGVQKGWVITEVDDEPYTEALLDDHIEGTVNYNMTFQTQFSAAGEAAPMANLYLKEEISHLSRGSQK